MFKKDKTRVDLKALFALDFITEELWGVLPGNFL